MSIRVEVWSDFVCPFCFLGKRRLEHAAAEEGLTLDVHWRSFELDPAARGDGSESTTALLMRKYRMTKPQAIQSQSSLAAAAAQEGIDFRWEIAKPGNTFDAHRLAHLAAERGLGGAAEERFMRAYMSEGEFLGDSAALLRLATSVGLDEADVRRVLDSDAYTDAVRADQQVARAELHIEGVPFFVIENQLAISGAQPRDLFRDALRRAASSIPPRPASSSPMDEGSGIASADTRNAVSKPL
jgi:predicted DsbA family dithiol-disulfide isomerase